MQDDVRIMVQAGKVTTPHFYLELWLMCRRLQGDSPARILPDDGSLLDQDYMVVWSFGIIDDAYRNEIDVQQSLERDKSQREQLRQNLLQKTKLQ